MLHVMLSRCVAILVALLLCQIAMGADPPALTDGIAAVGVGDYARAVQVLKPVAAERPDDSVANYWLGRAYYGQRQYRAAAKYLEMAENFDPRNSDVCLWHGRALRMAGKGKEAAEAFAAYVERFPQDNTMLAEYGAARAAAGDYAGARSTFTQLMQRDPSQAMRAAASDWIRALDGLASTRQLEPAICRHAAQYDLYYDSRDTAVEQVSDAVMRAQAEISAATGITLKGFRVLLFSSWASYLRYARILLPEGSELHAAAFSTPGTLVLWSPSDWPDRDSNALDLLNILRHELAHLAIDQRIGGEGIPTWLNEGMACYFGGWGGMQAGQVPAQPLPLSQLDQAFRRGDRDSQEQAYAQAQAMVCVLARKLGAAGLFKLADKLVDGTPLADAYSQLAGESLDAFLASWPTRLAGN